MIFRRAKVRLALSFAAVQLVLFAAFGFGIYYFVTTTFDYDAAESDSVVITAEAGFAALRNGIIIAYLALVVVIPVTSYLLASLAMRPILKSFEAQQRFIDDASHEFRTPLSALQAQLELGLRRDRSFSEYRTILVHSLNSTSQLIEILDDLLLLSRGAHDINIAMREVEVGSIVADAIDLLSPVDAARVLHADPPELLVSAAPSMLTRTVVNLLTNAMRYSPAESPVTLTISKHGGMVRISIEDHGVGMTRQDRERAFERFWRADDSRSSQGRGLGLSIVKEIVDLHGGRVELESELGVGTTASLELPLSR
ncbi:signal transduction histidine kinase [Salinibacterium sp. CAN_S4]|uniref:sensor histidine kinase n=1 Tax=Salinibacterium sp. CAN_S4 TaxID=2787727 RepID=UPI0018EF9C88